MTIQNLKFFRIHRGVARSETKRYRNFSFLIFHFEFEKGLAPHQISAISRMPRTSWRNFLHSRNKFFSRQVETKAAAEILVAGFGLVEIVVVTGIILITFLGFSQAGLLSLRLLQSEKENLEAMLFAQEAMEVARAIRDESWADNITPLANGTLYYLVTENGLWRTTAANPGLLKGKYLRSITFDQVFRKNSDPGKDQIASGGDTYDDSANTRKVTVRVAWGAKEKVLVSYLTRFGALLPQQTEAKSIFFESATNDNNLAEFPSMNVGDGDPAQAFTTSSAIKATKIELPLRRATASPSDIFAEIRTSPIGTVLGVSQVIVAPTIANTSFAWVQFRFSETVSLNAGIKYYIRLRSIPDSTQAGSGSAGAVHWQYEQSLGSPYAGGEARKNIGKTSPEDEGQILMDYDFGFRIYAMQ